MSAKYEQQNQFLLESAERLREQHREVREALAYTAPELITVQTRQWVSTTESLIDLFEVAVATPESAVKEATITVAAALLSDYSVPVDLSDVRAKVMEATRTINQKKG